MNNLLVGLWMFTHILYHGEVSPRPNPDLKMTLNFENSGMDTLKYSRDGDRGSCIRQASYKYDGIHLTQTVTAVDPNNAFFCGDDPDMQLGKTLRNTAYLKDGKLYLDLEMGEDVITYIWSPVK